jgi:hypothetical protein
LNQEKPGFYDDCRFYRTVALFMFFGHGPSCIILPPVDPGIMVELNLPESLHSDKQAGGGVAVVTVQAIEEKALLLPPNPEQKMMQRY